MIYNWGFNCRQCCQGSWHAQLPYGQWRICVSNWCRFYIRRVVQFSKPWLGANGSVVVVPEWACWSKSIKSAPKFLSALSFKFIWKPKVAHIWNDLIFKLKNGPLFSFIDSKYIILLVFILLKSNNFNFIQSKLFLLEFIFKTYQAFSLSFLFYQSLIIIWPTIYQFYNIAFMYQAYILMIIVWNVKSNQTTSMINCHSYDDTTHTLQMNSGLPCCKRE